MTDETNATTDAATDAPDVRQRALLLRTEEGDQYLLPAGVLEAFRVDDSILAALRGDEDVAGYREWFGRDYVIYINEGGSTAGWIGGCLWADFTRAVAGSEAKFNVVTDRAVAGVRG